MVKDHTNYAFKHKYLIDYRLLIILNERTLLLVTPNGKEHKQCKTMCHAITHGKYLEFFHELYKS